MSTLDRVTFNKIVDLLKPLMESSSKRQAFVARALYDASSLQQGINYEGSANQFTANLVRECDRFGEITQGESAVVALLQEARNELGYSDQQQIDQIIKHLADNSSDDMGESQNSSEPASANDGATTLTAQQGKASKLEQASWIAAILGVPLAIIAILISFQPNNSTTSLPTHTPTIIQETYTATATDIPATETETKTPTLTVTLTPTLTNTSMPAPESTVAPTHTTIPNTLLPTDLPQTQEYPCDGQIPLETGGRLNQVRTLPSTISPAKRPVLRGSTVEILQEIRDFGITWYEIVYENGAETGWINSEFVVASENCP